MHGPHGGGSVTPEGLWGTPGAGLAPAGVAVRRPLLLARRTSELSVGFDQIKFLIKPPSGPSPASLTGVPTTLSSRGRSADTGVTQRRRHARPRGAPRGSRRVVPDSRSSLGMGSADRETRGQPPGARLAPRPTEAWWARTAARAAFPAVGPLRGGSQGPARSRRTCWARGESALPPETEDRGAGVGGDAIRESRGGAAGFPDGRVGGPGRRAPPGTSHVGKHFLLKKPTPSCSRSRRRVRVPPRAADGQAPHSAFQRGARGPRRPCGHTRTSTPTLPRPEARALPTYSSASTLKTQRGNQSDFIENYAMCNSWLETTDAPSPPVRARFDLNSPSHSGTMC